MSLLQEVSQTPAGFLGALWLPARKELVALLSAAALRFADPGAAPQKARRVCLVVTHHARPAPLQPAMAPLCQCDRKGALPVGSPGPGQAPMGT